MKKIILIRGPICAGKSTIAELLLKKLPNSSLIDEDVFKRSIESKKTPKWRSDLAFEIALFLTSKLMQKKRTIIADIHSSKKDRYTQYKQMANKNGYKLYSFLIYPSLDTCILRNKLRVIPGITYKIDNKTIEKYWKNLYTVKNEMVFDYPESKPITTANKILKLIK